MVATIFVASRLGTKVSEVMSQLGYAVGEYDWSSGSTVALRRHKDIMYRLNPDHLPHHLRLTQQMLVPYVAIDFANSLTWTNSAWSVPMEDVLAEIARVSTTNISELEHGELPPLSVQYSFLFAVLHLFREARCQRTAGSTNLAQFSDIVRLWRQEQDTLRSRLPDVVKRHALSAAPKARRRTWAWQSRATYVDWSPRGGASYLCFNGASTGNSTTVEFMAVLQVDTLHGQSPCVPYCRSSRVIQPQYKAHLSTVTMTQRMTHAHTTHTDSPEWRVVDYVLDVQLVNHFGSFMMGYFETASRNEVTNHLLIYKAFTPPVPLRLQSGCLIGAVASDTTCDCQKQLDRSMQYIEAAGSGLIIYSIEHDGRGRGLLSKLKVYQLRHNKNITSQAACEELGVVYDRRSYLPVVTVLRALDISDVILLSANSAKYNTLAASGIHVAATRRI